MCLAASPYWTAGVQPSLPEAGNTGVRVWGLMGPLGGRGGGSFAHSALIMRAKSEEQVETRLERARDWGQEEGQVLKDKLVAQIGRVPWRHVYGCWWLCLGLGAGEEGEETSVSGGRGCRSKQGEAEPAQVSSPTRPSRTINKSPCEDLGCLPACLRWAGIPNCSAWCCQLRACLN